MKHHFSRLLVAIATAMLFATSVLAAGISNGLVTTTFVVNATTTTADSSVFIFKNIATIPGTPTCNTNQEYAIRLNTPAGKAVQSSVQLAIALGKSVFASGDGTWSAWGDRETVNFVYISW